MVVRPRGRLVGRRPRGNVLRPVEWVRQDNIVALPDGGGTTGLVLVDAPKLQEFTSPTIVRAHLNIFFFSLAGTLGNSAFVCMGVTQVNPTEPNPSPILERSNDRWQWWSCHRLLQQTTAVQEVTWGVNAWRLAVDIRSMRKVHNQDGQLVFAAGTNVDPSTIPVEIYVSSSVLIKE